MKREYLLAVRFVRGTKNINHSQFRDDTLLLEGASVVIVVAAKFKAILEIISWGV